MDIEHEILDYINCNEKTGALLLSGKWGCGKTYLIKEIADDINNEKSAAISIVSLFGIDNIENLNKRVKELYTEFKIRSLNRANKILKKTKSIIKDGLSVANVFTKKINGISAASKGISALLNYDMLDFFEVKNTVDKDEKRKFVLVFDDLERSNLSKIDLLGAINDYCENKEIKVIIIADEDKINSDEYKEYKEKIISRTLKISANYNTIIDEIINKYDETAIGYSNFLKENNEVLKQVFDESETENIRVLKCIIADFERVYETCSQTDIPANNLKWVLYSFAAKVYSSKSPNNGKNEKEHNPYSGLLSEEPKQYPNFGLNKSEFYSLNHWAEKGIWNKDAFLEELKEKYGSHSISSYESFLIKSFWDLNQKDIDKGLPTAVTMAYSGKLNCDQLISLITKVYTLKHSDVKLPFDIEYEKIKNGLLDRLKEIDNGNFKEPERFTFAEKSQLEPEAFELYDLIENFDELIEITHRRKLFIQFINGEAIPIRKIRNTILNKFDDELYDILIKSYANAENHKKREIARVLLSFYFKDDRFCKENDIETTKRNFERLIEWLNSQNSSDSITNIINKNFAENISKKSIMKDKNNEPMMI